NARGGSVVNGLLKLRSMATRRGFLQTTGAATLALASPPAVGETAAANCSFAERARKAHDQRAALCPGPRSADHVARYFARASLVDRFEEGLRPGTVRRLHDHRQWTAHQ